VLPNGGCGWVMLPNPVAQRGWATGLKQSRFERREQGPPDVSDQDCGILSACPKTTSYFPMQAEVSLSLSKGDFCGTLD